MSDRLSLPLHRTLTDPRTGQLLRAIGLVAGKPVFPIMGASEGAPEVGGSNAGGAGESGGAAGGGEPKVETSNEDGRDPQKKIAALEEEKDRHFRKANEAQKERDELAAKLKEYEDKDKSELERTQSQVEDLRSENNTLKEQLQQLQVDNSFFVENSIQWHDPEDAKGFVLRELGEVEVDKNGRVKGLKEAIEKVAKAKPYLVKSDPNGGTPPLSGQPPKKPQGNVDRAELEKKYPALRGR